MLFEVVFLDFQNFPKWGRRINDTDTKMNGISKWWPPHCLGWSLWPGLVLVRHGLDPNIETENLNRFSQFKKIKTWFNWFHPSSSEKYLEILLGESIFEKMKGGGSCNAVRGKNPKYFSTIWRNKLYRGEKITFFGVKLFF